MGKKRCANAQVLAQEGRAGQQGGMGVKMKREKIGVVGNEL